MENAFSPGGALCGGGFEIISLAVIGLFVECHKWTPWRVKHNLWLESNLIRYRRVGKAPIDLRDLSPDPDNIETGLKLYETRR